MVCVADFSTRNQVQQNGTLAENTKNRKQCPKDIPTEECGTDDVGLEEGKG